MSAIILSLDAEIRAIFWETGMQHWMTDLPCWIGVCDADHRCFGAMLYSAPNSELIARLGALKQLSQQSQGARNGWATILMIHGRMDQGELARQVCLQYQSTYPDPEEYGLFFRNCFARYLSRPTPDSWSFLEILLSSCTIPWHQNALLRSDVLAELIRVIAVQHDRVSGDPIFWKMLEQVLNTHLIANHPKTWSLLDHEHLAVAVARSELLQTYLQNGIIQVWIDSERTQKQVIASPLYYSERSGCIRVGDVFLYQSRTGYYFAEEMVSQGNPTMLFQTLAGETMTVVDHEQLDLASGLHTIHYGELLGSRVDGYLPHAMIDAITGLQQLLKSVPPLMAAFDPIGCYLRTTNWIVSSSAFKQMHREQGQPRGQNH